MLVDVALVSCLSLVNPASIHPRASVSMLQGNLFKMIETMPGAKAGALIDTYIDRIANIRANGFAPNVEAWMPDRQPQVKKMGQHMREVAMLAKAVGACANPIAAEDAVGSEPEAERVARTQVCAAIAATSGTAISFVSFWPDHISIDAVACNPAKLAVGEVAEKAVIKHVAELALARGCNDVRLAYSDHRFFQLGAEGFYESSGFYPSDELSSADQTILSYQVALGQETLGDCLTSAQGETSLVDECVAISDSIDANSYG